MAEKPEGGFKEIFTSLTIAFAMALAFRGFVVEGFVIPTGSMAPTLLGMHMRFQAPETGEDWPVGPWHYADTPAGQVPLPIQGQARRGAISVGVPGTGSPLDGGAPEVMLNRADVPRRGGDRIFVLKYLYQVFNPERFDVVVFKNPTNPYENYIKRLIGLPGEQIALVDGDVFTRPAALAGGAENPWEGDGWRVGRKKERIQRDLWYPVFDSRYTPIGVSFTPPWSGGGWAFSGDGVYRQDAPQSVLAWDHDNWPITDFVHYNDNAEELPVYGSGDRPMNRLPAITAVMPSSDIRTLVSVEPDSEGLSAELTLRTRGHLFRGRIGGGEAVVEMRAGADGASWIQLDQRAVAGPGPGEVSTIEFWHVDQALHLYVNGDLVAGGAEAGGYGWNPARRAELATGLSMEQIIDDDTVLFDAERYTRPELAWSFSGSALTVHRAGVWRDLYYQPAVYTREDGYDAPARATHPSTLVELALDEYFVCGDNSAKSQDSRLMTSIDPWVNAEFAPGSPGIVPRELLIGKAFFVYFPSLQWRGRIPVPDFGRMRFIR